MQKLRVVGYARVSHDEQRKYGYSIKTQIERIEKWCIQENHTLVRMYVDEGYSASTMKRPQMQELLQNLKDIDAIVFTRLDRFSRNVLEANQVLQTFAKYNVSIIATDEDVSTTDADGLFNFQLRVSLAERELKKGSERIKAVFGYKVKQAQAITGSLPLGYKIEVINNEKKVVKNEDEIEIVNAIFDYFITHQSIRRTMQHIQKEYGYIRCQNVFRNMLKNELYTGSYKGNKAYTEPYITLDQYNRIQELLKANIKQTKTARAYLFSGLIKCNECGYSLAGSCTYDKHVDKEYYYYRCSNCYSNNRCTNKKFFSERRIEKYLIENVEELIKRHLFNVKNINSNKKNIDKTKKRKKEINEELENLNYMFLKKRISKSEYDKFYTELEKELAQLKPVKKENTEALQKFLDSNWSNFYSVIDRDSKRTLWRNLIQEIQIDNSYNITIIFL